MIFKLFALIIMLIALFLLYRIAYPKKKKTEKDNVTQKEMPKSPHNIMGKSKFVMPDRSKPLQTPTTNFENEKGIEK